MSLLSDSLRAVVGLFPTEITPADHEAAAELPERWTARLKHWLGAPQDPWKYREPPADMEKIFERCAEPMDPLDNAEAQGPGRRRRGPGGELRPGHGAHPQVHRRQLAGAEAHDPEGAGAAQPLASDEAGDMEAVYAVLNDPAVLLQELDSGRSSRCRRRRSAPATRTCTSGWATTLQKLISERAALHKSWEPLWEQETQVATLKGLPPEEPFMAPTPPPLPKTPFQLTTEPPPRRTSRSSP
jgi:hypothetical protein